MEICRFNVFYEKLKNAPLIELCPVNLGCKIAHSLNLSRHQLIIGQVENTHITKACLTNDRPDVIKIEPFIFTTTPPRYYGYSKTIAKAFSVGKELEGRIYRMA